MTRRLSLAPEDHVYRGLVHRERGELVVHCVARRRRVRIEDCTRCGKLTGLSVSGLGQPRGVYVECRPSLKPEAPTGAEDAQHADTDER
jgi:hypothetical protein